MRYSRGQEVRIGDRVRLSDGDLGVVVFCIDSDEYSDEYPREDWSYLKSGAMIKTNACGLVHFAEDDPDLELVSSAANFGQGLESDLPDRDPS